jgi:hypothetical protein
VGLAEICNAGKPLWVAPAANKVGADSSCIISVVSPSLGVYAMSKPIPSDARPAANTIAPA